MRRTLLALSLAVLTIVALHAIQAGAQDKTARGTVTAMAGDSITVKSADGEMKFSVDLGTKVVARGAGTSAGRAAAAGQAGPKLSDVVKVGQAVEVSYSGMAGAMKATQIRALLSTGGGGAGGGTGGAKTQTASGLVTSVSLTSITIGGGAGGGAKFTRTFAIDSDTKVIGKGVGTAAAAAGGRTSITDLVGNGDRVSISFHAMGEMMHASEVRVMTKSAK